MLCEVLKPLHQATLALEGDNLTMPRVPSIVASLLTKLQRLCDSDSATTKHIARVFLPCVESRIGDVLMTVNMALMAAALHPAHHHLPGVATDVRAAVRGVLSARAEALGGANEAVADPFGSARPSALEMLKSVFAYYDQHLVTDEKRSAYDSDAEALRMWARTEALPLRALVAPLWATPASSAAILEAWLYDRPQHEHQLAALRELGADRRGSAR